MLRHKVNSSTIVSAGFGIVDSGDCVLEIEFKGGRIYHYFGVEYDVFRELLCAESVGGYFCKNIQKKYKFIKVEE